MSITKVKPSDFITNINLPTIPEVASRLVASLQNEDFDFDEIVDLIAKDPIITSTVLRHANSARYGLATKVNSVGNAIQLLGFITVRSIAIGASVITVFPAVQGLGKLDFWKSSEATALYASAIAGKLHENKANAWLAGFILRIGELLIAQHNPDAVTSIHAGSLEPGQRWSRQLDICGVTEGAIVAELASNWNFPDSIVSALREADTPMSDEYPFHELSGIVHLAGLFSDAKMNGLQAYKDVEPFIDPTLLRDLKLTSDLASEIYLKTAIDS